jgi:hypothetical protein
MSGRYDIGKVEAVKRWILTSCLDVWTHFEGSPMFDGEAIVVKFLMQVDELEIVTERCQEAFTNMVPLIPSARKARKSSVFIPRHFLCLYHDGIDILPRQYCSSVGPSRTPTNNEDATFLWDARGSHDNQTVKNRKYPRYGL